MHLLAGLLELIPFFGPTLGAIPAVIIAIFQGSWLRVGLIVAAFVVIQQVESNGMALTATNSATFDASITTNVIRQPGYSGGGANEQGNAMLFNVGPNSGSTVTACLNVTGNTISDTSASQTWDPNGTGASIYYNTKNTTTTRAPGYAGSATSDSAFAAYVQSLNTFSLAGASPVLATRFNGSVYSGGAACSTP